MNELIEILKEYSNETGMKKNISDLSSLEFWLIEKLDEERKFELLMDDLRDGKL